MRNALRLVLAGGLAAGIAAVPDAGAQPAAQPGPAPATTTPAPAVTTPSTSTTPSTTTPSTTTGTTATNDTRSATDANRIVDAATLESGANSFTEGQAQARMERAGLTGVQGLHKDDQGFWRGSAMQNGQKVEVALDFRGRIAAGPNLAALGTNSGHSASTATTGTSANPPGTAASRAIDSATGSNISGANPNGSRPDGTPGNPPGTAASRSIDRATGSNLSGANPPPPPTR